MRPGRIQDFAADPVPMFRPDGTLDGEALGVDGANYGVLERLDTLTGRRVDNTGFFAVDDIDTLTDADLYARLLSEFPAWIRAARSVGVIR